MSALAARVSGMGTSCDARSTDVSSQRESLAPQAARLPSCADIMLLSQWPRSAVSKGNGHIDDVSLRKQFGEVAEADWPHLYRNGLGRHALLPSVARCIPPIFGSILSPGSI